MTSYIDAAVREKRNLLEPEALRLLAAYGIPVPKHALAQSCAEAVAEADRIGYPVVMKIVSQDILHKSDVGGVELNLQNGAEVAQAYARILRNIQSRQPTARTSGILVEEMLRPGLECIIGMTVDASFGPALMFGLGGVFVEVLRDTSFRVLPLDRENAGAMLRELKAAPLLTGTRGQPPRDLEALTDLLLRVARLTEENPRIREIDLNPCLVYENGAVIADARILL